MYTISKDFAFSASHRLTGLAEGHPCARLHGHNYQVRVELTGPALDDVGMVLDYGDLGSFGKWLDNTVDHRHLNDVLGADNPTAENLARHLWLVAGGLIRYEDTITLAIGVSETPKTWAWYRR